PVMGATRGPRLTLPPHGMTGINGEPLRGSSGSLVVVISRASPVLQGAGILAGSDGAHDCQSVLASNTA
ncbi:MAG: hypothetical protein LC749_04630, partial [Actinobacteria bacterium]|nr:hypothetical protein [Actinomycetota bacterium]